MKYTDDSILHWSTLHEPDTSSITVQVFRWNEWVDVGKVPGQGVYSSHYSFKVSRDRGHTSFRVGYPEYEVYSRSLVIRDPNYVPVTFHPQKVRDSIWFSKVTQYKIYDIHGNIMLKGKAKSIYTKELEKGIYYIHYDSEMGKFRKK